MKALSLLFLIALLSAGEGQADEWADRRFREGGDAYREGRFEESVKIYEEIRERGLTAGPLDYNLGNAYFRLGQIGRAVASYHRALRSLPHDGDLRANIEFVEKRTMDQGLRSSRFPLLEIPGRLAETLRWVEWLLLCEIAYGILLLGAALFLFRPGLRPRLRTTLQTLSALLAVLVLLFFAALQNQVLVRKACVISAEAAVRSGPGARFTEEFVLHQGTVGRLRRTTDGWALMEISPDLTGWIPRETIEEI